MLRVFSFLGICDGFLLENRVEMKSEKWVRHKIYYFKFTAYLPAFWLFEQLVVYIGVLGLFIILRGSFGGRCLRVRARAMVECETVSFSSEKAQKYLEIIYFRKNGCFLSGFGKLNRFGYIGEEYSTFQNFILRRIKHAFWAGKSSQMCAFWQLLSYHPS